ncbi:MAG: hypothetical protein ACOH17_01055 [Cellulomonas sp.]|jgi:hypothetical protein
MTAGLQSRHTKRALGSALLVGVATVVAWLAVAGGVFVAFLAVSDGLATPVPVRLTAAAPASMNVTLPCVEGWSLEGESCEPAASAEQWKGGVSLPVRHAGGLVAEVYNVDPVTALLATAPTWGGLIAAGAVGLVLLPALRTTASGRPFAPDNARRLASAAAVVVLSWLLASVGPRVAAPTVIESIAGARGYSGFKVPTGWIAPAADIAWWPILIAVLLATLAAATRSGARLVADTDGLV